MQPTAVAVGKKAKQNKPQRGETRDDGETVPTTRSDPYLSEQCPV